jgi:universal stress protein A
VANYQHILAAVDLSDENKIVASRAWEMAQSNHGKLTLLHVVEYIPVDIYGEVMMPMDQDLEEQMVAHANTSLHELTQKLKLQGADERVARGSTKAEIINVAEELGADLIIIGRHGRHGISRLLGSTANAVLHHAPCDVLAINIPSD